MGREVTPIIEVESVSFGYRDGQVLSDVSFEVMAGEHLAIVGANGSGKSTLLKCLARLLEADTGRIRLFGRPLAEIGRRDIARYVAYVPQAHFKRISFTVREYLRLARYPYIDAWTGLGPADEAAVDKAMADTNITSLSARRVSRLSGGEAQKVLIAAALAQETPILLLDEATAFLDVKHKTDIHRLLRKLNGSLGKTIIQVTHDLNHAALSSRRILALKAGRIGFDGTPEAFMTPAVITAIYAAPLISPIIR